MEELRNVHYDAFISYRHSELDAFVAERIHKKLEAFKLPKSARAKVKNGKTRIERIFRDQEELPLSDNLMDPITNALNNSDYLITICTPRYLESKWCMKEIEVFLENHNREHVLVVLAEGEPEDSFPRILTFDEVESIDENGNRVITRREIEPLAADTRGENRRDVAKAIDGAIVKLCAEIFEINYDDLNRRQRKQRFRRNAMIFGSVGAVLLVFAIFALVMFLKISRQKETISDQYAELQDRYASSMETVSEKLMGDGRRKDAAYALRSVLPDDETDGYNSDALRSLYSVMNVYGLERKHAPRNIFEMESEIDSYGVSYDNRYVWISDGCTIRVFDTDSGSLVKQVERKRDVDSDVFKAAFCGSNGMVIANGDEVSFSSLLGGDAKTLDGIDPYSVFVESVDGTVTFACSDGFIIALDNNADRLFDIDLYDMFEDGFYYEFWDADFDDGRALLCFADSECAYLILVDEKTGEIITSLCEYEVSKVSGVLDGDELFYAATDDLGAYGVSQVLVCAYDLNASEYLWKSAFRDVFFKDVYLSDDYIFVVDEGMVLVIDRLRGGVANYYYIETALVSCWCSDNVFYSINYDGVIHGCDENRFYDCTEYFYVNAPSTKVVSSIWKNGELFCEPNAGDYIVHYATDDNGRVGIEYDCEGAYRNEKPADELLEKAMGEEYTRVKESVVSDDQKYVAALMSDHTVKIFDAGSMSEIAWFETEMTYLTNMKYYGLSKCYILSGRYESVFLDDKFEAICISNRIHDERDGKFIVSDTSNKCYLVPFVDYGELIRRTDEYLGDYIPSEAIRQKYNLE